MTDSNNFFQLVEEFKKQLDWLNQILKGNELDTVVIDGVTKPSIAKDIEDHYAKIQALVNGRLTFKTKADLFSSGAPENGEVAEVWGDTTNQNNGLYGWTGTEWVKSTYDVIGLIKPSVEENSKAIADNLPSVGISNRERSHDDGLPIPLIVDDNGLAIISIERESGKLIVDLDSDSSRRVTESVGLTELELPEAFDAAFLILDDEGRVALRVGKDGQVYFNSDQVDDLIVRHFFIRGQSLSMGYKSQPALSNDQSVAALSFGYRPDRPNFENLQPLIEFDDGIYGETPAAGAAGYFRREYVGRYRDNDLSKGYPEALVSIHSIPGVNIEALSKGTSIYNTTQDGAVAGQQLASKMGLKYQVGALLWVQGEANERDRTEPQVYAELLEKLIEDHNNDLKLALNNDRVKVPLITYQTNHRYQYTTPKTALGQLMSANRHPLVFMAGPIYQHDVVDHTHLTNYSSRRLGEKMMQAALAVEKEGDWQPLRPVRALKTGENEITAEFLVRYPPLVLDESEVVNPGNFGFEVLDGQDVNLSISSVSLGLGNTVVIRTNSPLPDQVSLAYAYHNEAGAASGRLSGARGNLRDSDPTLSVYTNSQGKPFNQYNYCVTFKEEVQ
ncbi:hypothetical protein HUO05_23910 (plasmid) [Vibrio alginolyticus]|uniref:sialate O-acetylesterase n=1 Tax=Vibrio alginolyticus TaxID=663 RepID=UPI001594D073|nr:sialate O-acetylesterase [Vibrio alginolyticus]QKS98246.1 hypothetical protein HUO05_23910 [Vibrio alginolyticus]